MTNKINTPWNRDRTEKLKELFFAGHTPSEIAHALRIEGLTKNAVLGKLYRLGLSKKREVKKEPVSLYRCQFPFGHVGEPGFHFCGKKVDPSRSYCDEHHELCYQKGTSQTPHRAYGPDIGHSFQVGRTTKDDVKDITDK